MVRRRVEAAREPALGTLEAVLGLLDRRDVEDDAMRFFCVAAGRLPKVRWKTLRVRLVTMPSKLPHCQWCAMARAISLGLSRT